MANRRSGLYRSCSTINLPASSARRFRGKLGGREGTFVLQGPEIVENGKIKATWFVVPGSGTGDLSGLRGEGGFEGDFGKGPKEPWIIGSNDVVTIPNRS